MRNSISHPKYDLGGIRSHNPTELLWLINSPKIKCSREIISLTGSFSHTCHNEELNRPGTFWRNHTTTPSLPWHDSLLKLRGVVQCIAFGNIALRKSTFPVGFMIWH